MYCIKLHIASICNGCCYICSFSWGLEHFQYYCGLDKSEDFRFYQEDEVSIHNLGFTCRGNAAAIAVASARLDSMLRPGEQCGEELLCYVARRNSIHAASNSRPQCCNFRRSRHKVTDFLSRHQPRAAAGPSRLDGERCRYRLSQLSQRVLYITSVVRKTHWFSSVLADLSTTDL